MLPIPLGDENPPRRRPWMTWALIAANAAVFLALNVGGGGRMFQISLENAREWGLLPGDLRVTGFLTCLFVHDGIAHLLGNMWFLHIFGDNVEDKLGRAGFLAFYLAAGVVASLAFLQFGRPSGGGEEAALQFASTPLIGASGAISGVTGVYLVFFPRARIRMVLWMFFPFFFALPAFLVIGMFLLQDTILAATNLGNLLGGVAYAAHVGGSAAGILVALALKPILRRRGGTHWDRDTGFAETVAADGDRGALPSEEIPSVRLPSATLRDQITGAVLDGRMDLALDLYRTWVSEPRRDVLPPSVEIEIAHEFLRARDIDRAVEAYRRFLGSHPTSAAAPEAKFRLGMIHARVTGDRARAREWLLQVVVEHPDEAARSLARRTLAEL